MTDPTAQLEAACMDRQGKKEANEIRFLCPVHDDHHPSARYNPKKNVWTCDVCQTGGSGKDLAQRLNIETGDSDGRRKRELKIVTTYEYGGWGTYPRFRVVRAWDVEKNDKTFFQQRLNDNDEWVKGLGKDFVVSLYHGEELAEAIAAGKPIYIVEGEKDVDRLRSFGLTATCNPMGAGKWKEHYSNDLSGADLIIIPDNDDPGRSHAALVRSRCYGKAARIRTVLLPGVPEKGDVSDWLDAGHTLQELQKLVDKTEEVGAATVPQLLKEFARKYDCVDGMLVLYKEDKGGATYPVPLCNFNAWITEEVVKDNSMTRSMHFRVKGELPGKRPLPEIEVTAKEFDSMNWVTPNWGIRALIDPSQSSVAHLRTAMKARTNGSLKHHTIFTHLGWREVDGEMMFLTAAGAVGREDIEVEPPTDLARYMLVVSPTGDPATSIQKSLAFLDVAPLDVTIPLWTSMYLAPLTEIVPHASAFTLWLVARSGSYKSVLTALALSHFGNFDYTTLPAKWSGTANGLGELLFLAKDLPFVIDDYAPAADDNAKKEQERKAERIIRSQGDRVGRIRMHSFNQAPRGLLLTSGEQSTSGYSRTSRILYVPLEKDAVYLPAVTQAQNEQYYYCEAMTRYIDWIRRNWKTLHENLPRRFAELRNAIDIGESHARMPQMAAGLMLGLETAAQFALDSKAITDSSYRNLIDSGRQIFTELAIRQAQEINEQSAARRFIDLLSSMHSQGKLRFQPKNATADPLPPPPGTSNIGWFENVEGGEVVYYVDMESAVEAIQRYSRSFTWEKDAVTKDLAREDKISRQDEKHLSKVIRVGGNVTRVVQLKNLDGLFWKDEKN